MLCFGLFLILLNIGFGHFPQGKEYSEGSIKLFLKDGIMILRVDPFDHIMEILE